MNIKDMTIPIETATKEVSIKDMIDEASCQMIETCCTLDDVLKGLGVDLGWDGAETNPDNMMDEAKILTGLTGFCMEASKRLRSLLF